MRAIEAKRKRLLASCLEAARLEVLRRLREANLPTSVQLQRLVLRPNSEGTGWSSDWEPVRASALRSDEILISVRDDSVPVRAIGLRDQLIPLAEFLHEHSDLGQVRPAGLLPNQTGPDAVLARYLSPLAIAYISNLSDVTRPSTRSIDRMDKELAQLCHPTTIDHTRQLALEGLQVARRLGPYRDVTLRPLSASERGEVLRDQLASMDQSRTATSSFVVPRVFRTFAPTTLLEIRTSRPKNERSDASTYPNRLALAFYLAGFEISGPGVLIGFDEPRWASMGFHHSPFPVTERFATDRSLSRKAFEAVVDLAHKIPDFAGDEGSGKEIALFRALRGFGAQNSGFLDFAIALEAALLGGTTTELTYCFSLYGALFLHDELDPGETFEKLKTIYEVRSKLVHGARVKPDVRRAAEQDAAVLARAVIKRAVESGWPDRAKLDALALG